MEERVKQIGLKTADGRWIARRVRIASSFRQRLRGLLGTKQLSAEEGLMLSPGGSVHTFGMRYCIDLAFLDRQLKILRVAPHVSPWRIRRAPAKTRHVLELPAGTAQQLQLRENTFVCVEHELPARAAPCVAGTRHTPFRFSMRIPSPCSRQPVSGTRAISGTARERSRERDA